MAMLALPVLGALVGGAALGTGVVAFGMTGVAIGWAAGGLLSSALGVGQKGQNQQGPRLGDLSVQASTYGTMKPIVYATWRVNGNVIWSTDKREVATTVSQGKGGPKNKQTTYRYYVDIAIALCANEIVGISQIFSNGKLIYDLSAGSSSATKAASATGAATFTLYRGTETQQPDPTIESHMGVGNVPAYRGMAYVVLGQLECPNGQIPQLSFLVIESGSVAPTLTSVFTGADNANGSGLAVDGQYVYTASNYTFGLGSLDVYNVADPEAPVLAGRLSVPSGLYAPKIAGDIIYAIAPAYSALNQKFKTYSIQASYLPIEVGSLDYTAYNLGKMVIDYPYAYVISSSGDRRLVIFNIADPSLPVLKGNMATDNVPNDVLLYDDLLYVCNENNVVQIISVADPNTPVEVARFTAGANPYAMAVEGSTLFIAHFNSPRDLKSYDLALPLAPTLLSTVSTGIISNTALAVSGGYAYISAPSITYVYDVSNPSAMVFVVSSAVPATSGKSINPFSGYIFGIGTKLHVSQFVPEAITASTRQLSSVITDICTRSGVDPADVDATTYLIATVSGYSITNVASGRANVDPLMQAYDVQMVESNGELLFRRYATLPETETVSFDELGASEDAQGEANYYPLQRIQESELPRSVTVNYVAPSADYQVQTEPARRIVTSSINDVVVELPVALTATAAADVADRALYRTWVARNKRTARVPRKYAHLDAGDRVLIEYPRGVYQHKQIVKATDTGAACEWDLVDYSAGTAYGSAPIGVSPSTNQAGVSLAALTQLEVLDIPMLRDADDNPGPYVALAGYGSNWSGAELYIGPDDTSLTDRGGVSVGTIIGSASTAMPTWTQGSMDMLSTVTVTVVNGALSNATRDAVLDSYANLALIGNEIVAFTTATLVSGNTYTLSGFLRGVRGTEGTVHAAGERFVMLQFAGLLHPVFDLSELNFARQYRALSIGRDLESQQSITATVTGKGLKPFAPVNLRRTTSGTDITLTWDRRTRSTVTFPVNGVDVPLFEASESYSIDAMSGSTVVGTVTSTSASVTITGAQQTSFGLTPGNPIKVRVYQVSATIGRGNYLEQTI